MLRGILREHFEPAPDVELTVDTAPGEQTPAAALERAEVVIVPDGLRAVADAYPGTLVIVLAADGVAAVAIAPGQSPRALEEISPARLLDAVRAVRSQER